MSSNVSLLGTRVESSVWDKKAEMMDLVEVKAGQEDARLHIPWHRVEAAKIYVALYRKEHAHLHLDVWLAIIIS